MHIPAETTDGKSGNIAGIYPARPTLTVSAFRSAQGAD
jgi:hypothetical protein